MKRRGSGRKGKEGDEREGRKGQDRKGKGEERTGKGEKGEERDIMLNACTFSSQYREINCFGEARVLSTKILIRK